MKSRKLWGLTIEKEFWKVGSSKARWKIKQKSLADYLKFWILLRKVRFHHESSLESFLKVVNWKFDKVGLVDCFDWMKTKARELRISFEECCFEADNFLLYTEWGFSEIVIWEVLCSAEWWNRILKRSDL